LPVTTYVRNDGVKEVRITWENTNVSVYPSENKFLEEWAIFWYRSHRRKKRDSSWLYKVWSTTFFHSVYAESL